MTSELNELQPDMTLTKQGARFAVFRGGGPIKCPSPNRDRMDSRVVGGVVPIGTGWILGWLEVWVSEPLGP